MIRCLYLEAGVQRSHLIERSPCAVHKKGTRSKQVALFVIKRDGRCWQCGTTENLEAGHMPGHEKARTGLDDPRFMRAECVALNRTGSCSGVVKSRGPRR